MLQELANDIGQELEVHAEGGGFQRTAGNPPRNMVVASQPRKSVIGTVVALLPLLAQCASILAANGQAAHDSSPQDLVNDNFDEETGNFDRHFVEGIRPQTRRANRIANRKEGVHHKPLTAAECDAITIRTLDKVRVATPEEFEAGWKEAVEAIPSLTVDPESTDSPPKPTDTQFNVSGSERESQSISASEVGSMPAGVAAETPATPPAPTSPPVS